MATLNEQQRRDLIREAQAAGGNEELLKRASSAYRPGYQQITAQDLYETVIRPQEEAELNRRIGQATTLYRASMQQSGQRNADAMARLGVGRGVAARAEGAVSSSQGAALADRVAGATAQYQRELDRSGRFALIDDLNQRRLQNAQSAASGWGTVAQIGNAVGGALLSIIPGAGPVLGPVATGAGGAGWGALTGGLGSSAATKIAGDKVTDAFIPKAPGAPNVGVSMDPTGAGGPAQRAYLRTLNDYDAEEYR